MFKPISYARVFVFFGIACLALFYCAEPAVHACAEEPCLELNKLEISSSVVGRYEPVEITVSFRASYDNPFDPSEIQVFGNFVTPSGSTIKIKGFYYQDFKPGVECGKERLQKKGEPVWKIRFTPQETGNYKYDVTIREGEKNVRSGTGKFNVRESDNPGFIRTDKDSVYYLKFDSGRPYFAVGESIAWTGPKQKLNDYGYYFSKLAETGCNHSRIWLVEWNLALEWVNYELTHGRVHGLGRYSLDNSWRLDYILELARQKGIYILLTLDTYGSLMEEKGYWGEGKWNKNPYNAVNGGPCSKPDDFWTNEEAKAFYKRRLEYIISRWGHSPNILSFELWNEVYAPPEWVREMAAYIKKQDPYKHLVTTSLGYPFEKKHLCDESETWRLEEIDYTQTHLYGERGNIKDMARAVRERCIYMVEEYKKPHIIAELGLDFGADDMLYDRKGKGTHLHNAFWAAAVSKSFGIPMTHWKEYVDRKDLYHLFKPVALFTKDIDWLSGKWNIARTENIAYTAAEKGYSDLVLECVGNWGAAGGEDITIERSGEVKGVINQFIHGLTKKGSLYFMPVFHVDYPKDGKFILEVDTVAQGAEIYVYLDDKEIWRHDFGADPENMECKSCRKDKRYNIYIAKYDKKYEINIPAGKHDIKIENRGKDWLRLKTIILTDYRDESVPFVRVYGMAKKNEAILWIQNKENMWYNVYNKKTESKLMKDISFDLMGLADGRYVIEWWDTYKGIITAREKAICKNNVLPVKVSKLLTDIACKIK